MFPEKVHVVVSMKLGTVNIIMREAVCEQVTQVAKIVQNFLFSKEIGVAKNFSLKVKTKFKRANYCHSSTFESILENHLPEHFKM